MTTDTDREHAQKSRFLVGCLLLVGVLGCGGLLVLTPASNLLMFVFGG